MNLATEMTPERQFAKIIDGRNNKNGRILGIGHPVLRLFAHDRAGRLCLRVVLPEDFRLRRLVSTRGIEIDSDTRLGTEPEISFVSRAPAMDAVFLSFVRFAVDRTVDAPDEASALQRLVSAYDDFRRYMEPERGLTAEALKGLVAELLVMEWLIGEGFSPEAVLAGWKGPFKDNKDFVLANGRAFEVKSAPYNGGSVRIASPEQLERNGLDLSLCVIHMEKGAAEVEGSVNLSQLSERLAGTFAAAGADPAPFHAGLEAYGLDPTDEASLSQWFVCKLPVQYAVEEGFPRIRRDSVPAGVSGVTFLLELAAAENFRVSRASDQESEVDGGTR